MEGSEEFRISLLSVSVVGEKTFPENGFLRFLKGPNSKYQIPSSSAITRTLSQAADTGTVLGSWVSWAAKDPSRCSEVPVGRRVWVPVQTRGL